MPAASPGGKVYEAYISAGGWGGLRTPDFGAVNALAAARRANASASALAALAPAAALESAMAATLPAVVRALSADLLTDHLLRHAAAGYAGYFAADLMRAVNLPLTYGLLNRAAGATAVCEGYSALPCPTLQAFAAVAAAAPGPLCSSNRNSSSSVPYLPLALPPPLPLHPCLRVGHLLQQHLHLLPWREWQRLQHHPLLPNLRGGHWQPQLHLRPPQPGH